MSQNISSYNPAQIQQLQQLQKLQQVSQNANQNFSAMPNTAPIADTGVVQNNPILNAAANTPDNPLTFLAGAGVSTVALMAINDLINKSLQTKQYDDTVFKQLETAVDKFASKPRIQTFLKNIDSLNNTIKTTANKSEILRNTPRSKSLIWPSTQAILNKLSTTFSFSSSLPAVSLPKTLAKCS